MQGVGSWSTSSQPHLNHQYYQQQQQNLQQLHQQHHPHHQQQQQPSSAMSSQQQQYALLQFVQLQNGGAGSGGSGGIHNGSSASQLKHHQSLNQHILLNDGQMNGFNEQGLFLNQGQTLMMQGNHLVNSRHFKDQSMPLTIPRVPSSLKLLQNPASASSSSFGGNMNQMTASAQAQANMAKAKAPAQPKKKKPTTNNSLNAIHSINNMSLKPGAIPAQHLTQTTTVNGMVTFPPGFSVFIPKKSTDVKMLTEVVRCNGCNMQFRGGKGKNSNQVSPEPAYYNHAAFCAGYHQLHKIRTCQECKIIFINQQSERKHYGDVHKIEGRKLLKPGWMSQEMYRSRLGIRCNSSSACPGCGLHLPTHASPAGKVSHSLDYVIHCIQDCPEYHKLGLAKTCPVCSMKFLNHLSLSQHTSKAHNPNGNPNLKPKKAPKKKKEPTATVTGAQVATQGHQQHHQHQLQHGLLW